MPIDDQNLLITLSDLSGFDPAGLYSYTSHSEGLGLLGERVAPPLTRFVSVADPRTRDALWRWAREKMNWPEWSYWRTDEELEYEDCGLVFSVYTVRRAGEVLWWASSRTVADGRATLPALAHVDAGLHAFVIVVRAIGRGEVKL